MNATNSKSVPRLLTVVVALQVFTLMTQWGVGPAAQPARAQIPDAGEQRVQMIEQMKATNEKLDKLLDLLKGGALQVKLAKPDETRDHG